MEVLRFRNFDTEESILSRLMNLFDGTQKIFDFNLCVSQGSFESEPVNLIVEREDEDSSIAMLHLYVTAFPADFNELQSLQGPQNLLTREEREPHIASSTTSRP